MRGTSTRRDHKYTHMPTRHDFSQQNIGDTYDGQIIRSLHIPKWIVEDLSKHDIKGLPQLNRSQLASGGEQGLPKKFVLMHGKKPRYVIREL